MTVNSGTSPTPPEGPELDTLYQMCSGLAPSLDHLSRQDKVSVSLFQRQVKMLTPEELAEKTWDPEVVKQLCEADVGIKNTLTAGSASQRQPTATEPKPDPNLSEDEIEAVARAVLLTTAGSAEARRLGQGGYGQVFTQLSEAALSPGTTATVVKVSNAIGGHSLPRSLLGARIRSEAHWPSETKTVLHHEKEVSDLIHEAHEGGHDSHFMKIRTVRFLSRDPDSVSYQTTDDASTATAVAMEMPFIGGDLKQGIMAMECDDAMELLGCGVHVLTTLQNAKIAHRDLKPTNILVRNNTLVGASGNEPKLSRFVVTDFGISEPFSETLAKRAMTPAWVAPEERGKAWLSEKGDTFQWGLIQYQASYHTEPGFQSLMAYRPTEDQLGDLDFTIDDNPNAKLDKDQKKEIDEVVAEYSEGFRDDYWDTDPIIGSGHYAEGSMRHLIRQMTDPAPDQRIGPDQVATFHTDLQNAQRTALADVDTSQLTQTYPLEYTYSDGTREIEFVVTIGGLVPADDLTAAPVATIEELPA